MAEPFSEDSPVTDAHERRQAEQRRLVQAYRGTFATAHGKKVLADLKKRFGFDRWEMDSEGLPDNTIARRVAMKGPIFHIERMRNAVLRSPTKPTRKGSDHHHEQPNPQNT